jgi:serine/threonine protein kinase
MIIKNELSRIRAETEIECHKRCNHFACVQLHLATEHEGRKVLIMEYCDAGDLQFQLSKLREANRRFDEREVRLILLQLILALRHMHNQKMLHRDVKSANVLLYTSGIVKVGDFGLSNVYDTLSGDVGNTHVGTPYYLSPELWARQRYGKPADMWSLGVVLYECLTNAFPFTGKNIEDLQRNVCESDPSVPQCSPPLQNIVKALLSKNPKDRPTTDDLLRNPYILTALHDFPKTVHDTARLTQQQKETVLASLAEVNEFLRMPVVPQLAANDLSVAYEGPVGKFKENEFQERYLVLSSGTLEVLRNSSMPRGRKQMPVASVEEIILLQEKGVFALRFQDGTYSWFSSPCAKEWDLHLRAAMGW